jgi:hypothetical protein
MPPPASPKRRDAGQEKIPSTEGAGQPAARAQRDRVGDEIAGNDPCSLRWSDGKATRNITQRDVGDRRIEHFHEGCDGHDHRD